jgi:tRNA nucleotidyltransferase (CCA-adding enzyme)
MKTFLVGGAVRDSLMGVTPKDLDYVVVDETPDTMLQEGFTQVGADFPVFIHPVTGDEYALARTERKEGTGYSGFTSKWEGITLEQDLSRRDLTINSIACSTDGGTIDPLKGQQDITNKVLRHTSEAFSEDPVRVLRIARFLARFGEEWTVAPETYALCQRVAWAEFEHLTPERVFKEFDNALSEPYPWLFFEFLYMLDSHWFKELWDLKGIPQPVIHHPECETFEHVMLALKQGKGLDASNAELFAILCHDFGKAPCWKERGNLHGHEEAGVPYVEAFCARLKVPSAYQGLAVKVCENHQRSHRALDMRPKSLHNLFKKLDCFRNPLVLKSFSLCNWADATGRTGFEEKFYSQAVYLHECLLATTKVDTKGIAVACVEKGLTGAGIGDRIRLEQINVIREVKRRWDKT